MTDQNKPTDMDKILKRIKKMLALADNNPNPHESATAAAMAEKLMRKFNLEHADVLIEELEEDSIVAHESGVGYAGRVPTWVSTIIVSTANLHDCEARYNFNFVNGKEKKVITFLGEKSDVIVAVWVFEYLMGEIRRHTNNYKKETYADGVGTASFRKACAAEVSHTIRQMIKAKEAELQTHSSGTALVLRKTDLVKQKFDVKYRKGSRTSYGDASAAHAGAQAGKSISVRQGVKDQSQPKRRLK